MNRFVSLRRRVRRRVLRLNQLIIVPYRRFNVLLRKNRAKARLWAAFAFVTLTIFLIGAFSIHYKSVLVWYAGILSANGVLSELGIAVGAAMLGVIGIVFSLSLFSIQQVAERGTLLTLREYANDWVLRLVYWSLAAFTVFAVTAAILVKRLAVYSLFSNFAILIAAVLLLKLYFNRAIKFSDPHFTVSRIARRGLKFLATARKLERTIEAEVRFARRKRKILKRRLNWRRLRFELFERNPNLFAGFEASVEELQTVVFRFAELKRYDVVQHALNEIQTLISQYLIVRDRSILVPGSSVGLFSPSDIRFDSVLTRQLERLKAQAGRGIERLDQEIVKDIASVLANLSKFSLNVRSYFTEYGENPVAGFLAGYLWGVIQDSAIRRLDDVGLEGADHLRDLCRNLIDRQFFINVSTQLERLEQLAIISLTNLNDIVLQAAVSGLSDCLLHSALNTYPNTYITSRTKECLVRITKMRLASPLGLDMNTVSYSIGPFISPTERSSLVGVNVQLANGIAQLSATQNDANWEVLSRLRSSYRELHDDLWLQLADIGVESIKKNSFLTHYVNSSLEEIVKINVWLLDPQRFPKIDPITDRESATEQHSRDSFRDAVRDILSREITGVYSRMIPAMFEHRQLNYLNDTIEEQCTFAFWCIDVGIPKIAIDACERIFVVCSRLRDEKGVIDVYGSARTAIHIAEIGTYALARSINDVLNLARKRYQELQAAFQERYPDLRFVGDFVSAERDLIENRRTVMFSIHDRTFFSGVTDDQIHAFFQFNE